MMITKLYNPLDKENLAESIVRAILAEPASRFPDADDIVGAGIYAIYYLGAERLYSKIAAANKRKKFAQPIYVGKAIPKGARKGGLGKDSSEGRALRTRLNQHAESIDQADNLNVSDFYFKSLVVDDVWIPLGENMLIEEFKPVWNIVLDGFGNKDPGRRRKDQFNSYWDVVHPGRKFADKLAINPVPRKELVDNINIYLNNSEIRRPKKRK